MELWQIIVIYLLFTVCIGGPLVGAFTASRGLEFCNPKWIYEEYSVNWFGVICICTLFHIICLGCAIMYWFYKLCTVGRE